MGKDIQAFHGHTLDTSSIEALAHDISKRLEINVSYGFWSYDDLSELTGYKGWDKVVLGSVTHKPGVSNYWLYDDNYIDKLLYSKYGQELINLPAYQKYGNSDACTPKWLKSINVIEYKLESENEERWLYIYRHVISSNEYYYARWFDLCRAVCEGFYLDNDYKKESDYLSEYRRDVLTLAKSLGGNEVYYTYDPICDEYEEQAVEEELTWDQFTKYIDSKIGSYVYDIPAIFTNKRVSELLKKKHEYKQKADVPSMNENKMLMKIWSDTRCYPEAFIDNGRDLG